MADNQHLLVLWSFADRNGDRVSCQPLCGLLCGVTFSLIMSCIFQACLFIDSYIYAFACLVLTFRSYYPGYLIFYAGFSKSDSVREFRLVVIGRKKKGRCKRNKIKRTTWNRKIKERKKVGEKTRL